MPPTSSLKVNSSCINVGYNIINKRVKTDLFCFFFLPSSLRHVIGIIPIVPVFFILHLFYRIDVHGKRKVHRVFRWDRSFTRQETDSNRKIEHYTITSGKKKNNNTTIEQIPRVCKYFRNTIYTRSVIRL